MNHNLKLTPMAFPAMAFLEYPLLIRDELKLNRPDVGWYQIRNALKARNESEDFPPVNFSAFETAYKTLSAKLQPQVFELGFLR